jgi:hypothetical protein
MKKQASGKLNSAGDNMRKSTRDSKQLKSKINKAIDDVVYKIEQYTINDQLADSEIKNKLISIYFRKGKGFFPKRLEICYIKIDLNETLNNDINFDFLKTKYKIEIINRIYSINDGFDGIYLLNMFDEPLFGWCERNGWHKDLTIDQRIKCYYKIKARYGDMQVFDWTTQIMRNHKVLNSIVNS